MQTTAEQAWASLDPPWQAAYDQAWVSWCAGSLGIGATLVDPANGEIVSVGRNRVSEETEQPQTISGNFMAHAEMNAFAAMRRFKADGLHLYTTLEPCLMCAGTAVFLHVEQVFFAAADEFFEGIDELWEHHGYSRKWKPARDGPLDDPLAGFARVLPLSRNAEDGPDSNVMSHAAAKRPELTALAIELANDQALARIRDGGGTTLDALQALWPRLPQP